METVNTPRNTAGNKGNTVENKTNTPENKAVNLENIPENTKKHSKYNNNKKQLNTRGLYYKQDLWLWVNPWYSV